MSRSLQILIVGADPGLREEISNAMQSIGGAHGIHVEADPRRGVEVASVLSPDAILFEAVADPDQVAAFAEEAAQAAPETTVIALFDKDELGDAETRARVTLAAMRARVRDVIERPVSGPDLRVLLERVERPAPTSPAPRGRIASFVSNKGGVGKTTLAVNTAVSLARRSPDRVLLVDLSLQLGLCAMQLDLDPITSVVDAARQRGRMDETLLRELALRHESGLRLLAAPRDAVDAAEVDENAVTHILRVARRAFDVVLVDSFPVLDSVMVSVLDLSDAHFVVLQPQVPVVVGTARFLKVLDGLGAHPSCRRLVLNQNSPRHAGQVSIGDIEDRLDAAVDYRIPFDRRVPAAVDRGIPIAMTFSRRLGFGKAVEQIVRDEVFARGRPVRSADLAQVEEAQA